MTILPFIVDPLRPHADPTPSPPVPPLGEMLHALARARPAVLFVIERYLEALVEELDRDELKKGGQ